MSRNRDQQAAKAVAQGGDPENDLEKLRNYVAFGNQQVPAGKEIIAGFVKRLYFRACVRKAICLWNAEMGKKKGADAAKLATTASEIFAALTEDPVNLSHKLITGQLLHDIAEACVEAESLAQNAPAKREPEHREDSEHRTPKGRNSSTETLSQRSDPIIIVPDPLEEVHAIIGKPGALKLAPEFLKEVLPTRSASMSRVHTEAWNRIVKGSIDELAISKLLKAGPGHLDVKNLLGAFFDDDAVYRMLTPMAVSFVIWIGKKEGEKPSALVMATGELVIQHVQGGGLPPPYRDPFAEFVKAFPTPTKCADTPKREPIITNIRATPPAARANQPSLPGLDAYGKPMLFPARWCRTCGGDSHLTEECRTTTGTKMRCYVCDSDKHMKWICPKLKA